MAEYCSMKHISTMFLLFTTGVLMVLPEVRAVGCSTDTTPPALTCSNVTLTNPFPNIFRELQLNAPDGYTYRDDNPAGDTISYSLPTFFNGYRYPPGYTKVTLTAGDLCGNSADCVFYVSNTLTELPVECPDLNLNVTLGEDQSSYNFTPSFGTDDITFVTGVALYQYVGDDGVSINVTADGDNPVGSDLGVGTHEIKSVIYDAVLKKTCISHIFVKANTTQNAGPGTRANNDFTSPNPFPNGETNVTVMSTVSVEDGEKQHWQPRHSIIAGCVGATLLLVCAIIIVVVVIKKRK